MALQEHDIVALLIDLPAHGLRAGDVGAIVLVHQGGAGFEVEFCTLAGTTVAVATVRRDQVRPIDEGDVANARRLAG